MLICNKVDSEQRKLLRDKRGWHNDKTIIIAEYFNTPFQHVIEVLERKAARV